MGTLFDQDPRKIHNVTEKEVIAHIHSIDTICEETGYTVDQVIKVIEILERKRGNTLYLNNGDIHDEQMAGLGGLISELIEVIRYLKPED